MPEKIESNQYSNLSTEQAALYQKMVDQTIQKIDTTKGIERKGLVLKLLTTLKQIGNHPYQYMKQGELKPEASGKLLLLLNILDNINENNEKVLIFTQYKENGEVTAALYSTAPRRNSIISSWWEYKKRERRNDRPFPKF